MTLGNESVVFLILTLDRKCDKILIARLTERVRVNMHFTEDSERYKILDEVWVTDSKGKSMLSKRYVEYLLEPKRCKKCHRMEFYRKDRRLCAPFMENIDGAMVNVFVYKRRFICKGCGMINTVSDCADFNKAMRARKAALDVIANKDLTMQEETKRGGFSHALGSAALKTLIGQLKGNIALDGDRLESSYAERVESYREMIESFVVKETLAFIPFLYEQKWRCLVCTWDPETEDAYLLDILESTDLSKLDEFHGRIKDKSKIETVFGDADQATLDNLISNYPDPTDVEIARYCMHDAIGRYYAERLGEDFYFSHKPFKSLIDIVCNARYNTWDKRWRAWVANLDESKKTISQGLFNFVDRNHEKIDSAFYYEYCAPYISLLNEIHHFRNNGFELLRMRFLIDNHAHFDKTYEGQLLHAISFIHAPIRKMSITNFGVRISDLVAELRAERELHQFDD